MHVASCLAGLAFNASSLGLNHGMAHQLGAVFHIPHGRANSILLPYIIEFNSEIKLYSRSKTSYAPCVTKYCNMARILGVSHLNEIVTIRALISYIRFMSTEMGMPQSVSEALPNLTKEEYESKISLMAKNALQDGCTATNPRIPTVDDVIELYKMIWVRKKIAGRSVFAASGFFLVFTKGNLPERRTILANSLKKSVRIAYKQNK